MNNCNYMNETDFEIFAEKILLKIEKTLIKKCMTLILYKRFYHIDIRFY